MPVEPEPFTEDAFLDGRLRLRQPSRGHRVGTDALLAAAAAEAEGRVADVGAGVGLIGLALLRRGAAEAVLIERDPVFAACARENIRRNGLPNAVLVEADIFDRRAVRGLPALQDQSFDHVATNPPYDQAMAGRRAPAPLKRAAHQMSGGGLREWLAACLRLLKHGGTLTLIHRADRLAHLLEALPRRAGGLVVRPVQPRASEAATRVLLRARAGSRAPLRLLPPLILHDESGAFTPEAARIHRGEAEIAMD